MNNYMFQTCLLLSTSYTDDTSARWPDSS